MRISVGAFILFIGSKACLLGGYESGECKSVDDISDELDFCGDVVTYTACVPKSNQLFPNITTAARDRWVRDLYTRVVARRQALEEDDGLKSAGVNEHGVPGSPERRFTSSSTTKQYALDCQNAYRNFLCWANFPRCNDEEKSLIMCKSACENYFVSCRYGDDLERCGPAAFHNAYEPEGDEFLDKDGFAEHVRDFFPGQPFRANEFDESGEPVPVCTPSIKNSSPASSSTPGVLVAAVLLALVTRTRG